MSSLNSENVVRHTENVREEERRLEKGKVPVLLFDCREGKANRRQQEQAETSSKERPCHQKRSNDSGEDSDKFNGFY